ncbi:hypothetical protein ABH941_003643 [Streptacidiphilus sp. EB103A]
MLYSLQSDPRHLVELEREVDEVARMQHRAVGSRERNVN